MSRIEGLAIVCGCDADLGAFTESIDPRALDRTVTTAGADLVLLRNHDATYPLARRSAGTLQVSKRSDGLYIVGTIDPDVSFAADTARLIQRGDAPGASFAFATIDDIWSVRGNKPHRVLLDMSVSEVSCAVTFPCYQQTRLSVHERSDSRSTTEKSERYYDTRIRLAR